MFKKNVACSYTDWKKSTCLCKGDFLWGLWQSLFPNTLKCLNEICESYLQKKNVFPNFKNNLQKHVKTDTGRKMNSYTERQKHHDILDMNAQYLSHRTLAWFLSHKLISDKSSFLGQIFCLPPCGHWEIEIHSSFFLWNYHFPQEMH